MLGIIFRKRRKTFKACCIYYWALTAFVVAPNKKKKLMNIGKALRASTTSSAFLTRWTISWAIHYVLVAYSFNIGAISKTTYSWDTFCSDSSASARHSWYNGSLMGGMAHEFSENNPYRTSSILINSPNAQFNWLLDPPSHIEKCRAARKIK